MILHFVFGHSIPEHGVVEQYPPRKFGWLAVGTLSSLLSVGPVKIAGGYVDARRNRVTLIAR